MFLKWNLTEAVCFIDVTVKPDRPTSYEKRLLLFILYVKISLIAMCFMLPSWWLKAAWDIQCWCLTVGGGWPVKSFPGFESSRIKDNNNGGGAEADITIAIA